MGWCMCVTAEGGTAWLHGQPNHPAPGHPYPQPEKRHCGTQGRTANLEGSGCATISAARTNDMTAKARCAGPPRPCLRPARSHSCSPRLGRPKQWQCTGLLHARWLMTWPRWVLQPAGTAPCPLQSKSTLAWALSSWTRRCRPPASPMHPHLCLPARLTGGMHSCMSQGWWSARGGWGSGVSTARRSHAPAVPTLAGALRRCCCRHLPARQGQRRVARASS
jgi:hypothetical protein